MDYWQRVRTAFGPGTLITVGAGVIVRRGRLFLLQRRSNGGDWGLPGGAKELGESLEGTARRELREETGLVGRIEHVAALYEATEVEGDLRPDEHETLELDYFGVEGLPRMQPLSRLLLEHALNTISA